MFSATKQAFLLKKIPSTLYKTLANLWIDKEFPRHLFIEVCAQCNLACEFCPRENLKGNMPWELFTKIIDEASQYGRRSFSLHLFNEPMLYPKIFDAVEYIKNKNSNHTVLLTTNGTTLNQHVDKLIKSKVDKVLWSWRQEPKWSTETKEKLKNWNKFTVRIIKEVTTKEAYEEFIKWPRIETRRLHNYGGEVDTSKYGVKSTNGKRFPCYHLWLAPAVSWNGKFLMCCADPHQKEVFGDLTKENVREAWQRLETVRKSHLEGRYEGICKNCDVWKEYPDLFFGFQKYKSS